MGVPSTFSSRTKTARPLASWPVTTVRTFIPCLCSSGLFMVTFLSFRVVEVIFCKCLTAPIHRESGDGKPGGEARRVGAVSAPHPCPQDVGRSRRDSIAPCARADYH